MNRLDSLTGRALELAHLVGDNVKHAVPRAGELLDAGARLGVVKTGARVAGNFVRRNPVWVAAAVAGAGLLWYAAHRRAKRAERTGDKEHDRGAIEGSARRVDAKRATRKSPARAAGRSRTASRPREQQPNA